MKPFSLLSWLSIVALGSGCATKYSVTPSYYSSDAQRQVLVVQKTYPPADKIALGTFGTSAVVGLIQFASASSFAAELDKAAYPIESPAEVRGEAKTNLGVTVGAGVVAAGLLYLGLRNSGFPRTRSIYSCTASFVGFESKKKLSEEAFQAFIKEGQCRHTHTHGDYLWGLGFLPRNLPNY